MPTPSTAAWCPARRPPTRRCGAGRRQRFGWLLRELHGDGFTALVFGSADDDNAAARLAQELAQAAQGLPVALTVKRIVTAPPGGSGSGTVGDADAAVLIDAEGLAARRYDAAASGAVYLLRPDQHVCARWRRPSAGQLRSAVEHALALA